MDGGTGSGDSIATIDVPDDGVIVNAQIYVAGVAPSSNTAMIRGELNFGSSNSFDTNDARTVICQAIWNAGDIQTAEAVISHSAKTTFFPDGLIVFAGERIHMHTSVAAISASEAVALIVFRFKTFTSRRR